MALTKEKLLQTINDSKEIEIDKLDGETVKIRPLSDAEYSEVENLTMSSFKTTKSLNVDKLMEVKDKSQEEQVKALQNLGIDIDLSKMKEIEKKTDYIVCKYGLSVDEEWTEEEVGQLPTGVPSEIADKILEYTGVKDFEEIEKFRRK